MSEAPVVDSAPAKVEDVKAEAVASTSASDNSTSSAVDQILFYLSDSNLPYDKFLYTTSQANLPEPDAPMGTGWVAIKTLTSFKRMRPLMEVTSLDKVTEELRKVDTVVIDEAGERIRRKNTLTPPAQTGQLERTVYAKGFPSEEKDDDLQGRLEKWFRSLGVGAVNAVRMRRDLNNKERPFKNSVFVEFASVESAERFLKIEPKPKFEDKGEDLLTMTKKEYIDMKAAEHGSKPNYADSKPRPGPKPFNAFKSERYENDKDSNKRKFDDVEKSEPAREIFYEGKKLRFTEEGKIENIDDVEFRKNRTLVLECEGGAADNSYFDLKTKLHDILQPSYVELNAGDKKGVILFREEATDDKITAIENAKIEISGKPVVWKKMSDEEEKNFHIERAQFRAKAALNDPSKRADNFDGRRGGAKRGRGNGRGGGRGGRGRGDSRGGRGGRGRGRGSFDRNSDRSAKPKESNGSVIVPGE